MSGQRERPPGLHRHPPTWERRGLEAKVRPGFLCSLLRLSRRAEGNRGQGWGSDRLGAGSTDVTQEYHREGSEGRRRKDVFLSFFLNLFPFPIFSFLFSVTTMRLELM